MAEIKLNKSEKLANLKSVEERRLYCEKQGQVYLGEGYSISKENYDRVILFDQAIKYGDDPYRKENT